MKRKRTNNIMLKDTISSFNYLIRITYYVKYIKAHTYSLTYNWVFNAIDSTSKNSKGKSSMETKVEKHVPSFSAYSDCTVEKKTFKNEKKHTHFANYTLEKCLT